MPLPEVVGAKVTRPSCEAATTSTLKAPALVSTYSTEVVSQVSSSSSSPWLLL